MFLCRRTRCFASTPGKLLYSLAGAVEAGALSPQDVTWTLCDKLRVICSPRGPVNKGFSSCETLQDNSVRSTGCKFSLTSGNRRPSVFTLKPAATATPEFKIWSFSWTSSNRKTPGRIPVPACFFGPSTEMWTGRSCTEKVLSRALSTQAKQKELLGPAAEEEKSTKSPQGVDEDPEPKKKQSKTVQLRKVFKEYGAVGVSFHIGISLISLGIFYLAFSSGIDMAAVLCKMGFSEAVVQSKMAAGTSTFVLAYAVHKLFAPLRISITVVSVPFIVRYLRKTGLFKPPPPSL